MAGGQEDYKDNSDTLWPILLRFARFSAKLRFQDRAECGKNKQIDKKTNSLTINNTDREAKNKTDQQFNKPTEKQSNKTY